MDKDWVRSNRPDATPRSDKSVYAQSLSMLANSL